MHPGLGKNDQRVPLPDTVGKMKSLLFHLQRRHPLMTDHGQLIPAVPDHGGQQLLRVGGGADVDLRGAKAQHRGGPGAAPVPVGDHLAFVNDRHVVLLFQIRHLDGGALDPAVRHLDLLLSGYQGTGNVRQIQGFKLLKSQQPQGAEIDSLSRRLQALDTFPGFSGIGGPQVQHKFALHLPRQGIEIPDFLRHGLHQRLPQPLPGFPVLVLPALQMGQGLVLPKKLLDPPGGEVGLHPPHYLGQRLPGLLPRQHLHGFASLEPQAGAAFQRRILLRRLMLQIAEKILLLHRGVQHGLGNSPAEEAVHQRLRHRPVPVRRGRQLRQIPPEQKGLHRGVQPLGDPPRVPLQAGGRLPPLQAAPGLPDLLQRPAGPQGRPQKMQVHLMAVLQLRLNQGLQPLIFLLIILRQLAARDLLIQPVLFPGLIQGILEGFSRQVGLLFRRRHTPGDHLHPGEGPAGDLFFHFGQKRRLIGLLRPILHRRSPLLFSLCYPKSPLSSTNGTAGGAARIPASPERQISRRPRVRRGCGGTGTCHFSYICL